MKTISQSLSGMPQMKAAFNGWTQKLQFLLITQQIVNSFVADVKTTVTMTGTVQPLTPEQVAQKPEGQRSWEWLEIHQSLPGTKLAINDRIVYAGQRYKVMARKDYSLNGFVIYHVIQDYQDE